MDAFRYDAQLAIAYSNNTLKVNADHTAKRDTAAAATRAGTITVRQRGGSGWHILLDRTCTSAVGIEKYLAARV